MCHPFVPGAEARAAFLQHTRKVGLAEISIVAYHCILS